jgi:putative transposase
LLLCSSTKVARRPLISAGKLAVSQATFYQCKKQYAGLGVLELRELRQLRKENGRLKRLVADLSLDQQILLEIVSKKL